MIPMKKLIASLTVMASIALAAPQATAGAVYHHWSETPAEVQATHSPEVIQGWIDAYWVNEWVRIYWERIAAFSAAFEAAQRAAAEQAAYPSGQCGGDLPPCWVMRRESRGDIRIWNGGCYNGPCGGGASTASGKWQVIRGTWNGYGGYRNAADAPEQVQDDFARGLWAGGRGCSHWSAC